MWRLPCARRMRLLLTLALACRRSERDRGRLVAVELHGRLCRRDVPARSGCGRFALARDRCRAPLWCAADPCQYYDDGRCAVLRRCAMGDCGTGGPVVSGTLPDAIGSLACRSKITRLCARPPARRSRPCGRHPTPLSARPGTSPPTHAARRVIAGYPGLVGTVPPTISALTALTRLCVRPSSSRCGPCRAARAHGCACASACSTERDQALGQVWLRRS
jgi:hypothetical protein